MRVRASRAIWVEPGDEVSVSGKLPSTTRLGRLYVFAREGKMRFSPYVQNLKDKMSVDGLPRPMTPMSMRLTSDRPEKEFSFAADFSGYLCVMQELDTAKDVKAKIDLKRRICPDLPWQQRVIRRINGLLAWSS